MADAESTRAPSVPQQVDAGKPKRIQRKRTAGWRMPPNTIYVGRPSRWGNPFHGDHLDPRECVRAYQALLERDFKWFRKTGFLPWTAGFQFSWVITSDADVEALVAPLRGKDLACWCPPGKPCHADVLLRIANGGAE